MLLIIDNQSQYIKRFRNDFLAEMDIPFHMVDHNEPVDFSLLTQVKGIILSGGKGNPFQPLNLTANFQVLFNFDVPIIGFCLGHEIIAAAWRSKIKRLPVYQNRKCLITIDNKKDPIFSGLGTSSFMIQKKHRYHISTLSSDFITLAHSDVCQNEVIRHKKKPIYGFQGHPEVSSTDGLKMVSNFLKMCDLISE